MPRFDAALKKQVLGFILSGIVSTALMYLVYLGLRKYIGYQLAYFIGYSLSVIALYFINSLWVFENKTLSWSAFVKFSLIYVLQYVCGAGFLEVIVRYGFHETYAPLIVILMLLPVTFLLNRLVLQS